MMYLFQSQPAYAQVLFLCVTLIALMLALTVALAKLHGQHYRRGLVPAQARPVLADWERVLLDEQPQVPAQYERESFVARNREHLALVRKAILTSGGRIVTTSPAGVGFVVTGAWERLPEAYPCGHTLACEHTITCWN